MKAHKLLSFGVLLLINIASIYSQTDTIFSFESFIIYKTDTLNRVDEANRKVGGWIIFSPKNTYEVIYIHTNTRKNPYIIKTIIDSNKCTLYTDDYYIESIGLYIDGKKNKTWLYYHKNGVLQKKIKFKDGHITRSFKTYYDDNKIMMKIIRLFGKKFLIKKYSDDGKLLGKQLIDEKQLHEIFP
jgi:hypothetical protein